MIENRFEFDPFLTLKRMTSVYEIKTIINTSEHRD